MLKQILITFLSLSLAFGGMGLPRLSFAGNEASAPAIAGVGEEIENVWRPLQNRARFNSAEEIAYLLLSHDGNGTSQAIAVKKAALAARQIQLPQNAARIYLDDGAAISQDIRRIRVPITALGDNQAQSFALKVADRNRILSLINGNGHGNGNGNGNGTHVRPRPAPDRPSVSVSEEPLQVVLPVTSGEQAQGLNTETAERLRSAMTEGGRNPHTRLPNADARGAYFRDFAGRREGLGLLFLDGNDFGQVNKLHNEETGNFIIRHLGGQVREAVVNLRSAHPEMGFDRVIIWHQGGDEMTVTFERPTPEAMRLLQTTIGETTRRVYEYERNLIPMSTSRGSAILSAEANSEGAITVREPIYAEDGRITGYQEKKVAPWAGDLSHQANRRMSLDKNIGKGTALTPLVSHMEPIKSSRFRGLNDGQIREILQRDFPDQAIKINRKTGWVTVSDSNLKPIAQWAAGKIGGNAMNTGIVFGGILAAEGIYALATRETEDWENIKTAFISHSPELLAHYGTFIALQKGIDVGLAKLLKSNNYVTLSSPKKAVFRFGLRKLVAAEVAFIVMDTMNEIMQLTNERGENLYDKWRQAPWGSEQAALARAEWLSKFGEKTPELAAQLAKRMGVFTASAASSALTHLALTAAVNSAIAAAAAGEVGGAGAAATGVGLVPGACIALASAAVGHLVYKLGNNLLEHMDLNSNIDDIKIYEEKLEALINDYDPNSSEDTKRLHLQRIENAIENLNMARRHHTGYLLSHYISPTFGEYMLEAQEIQQQYDNEIESIFNNPVKKYANPLEALSSGHHGLILPNQFTPQIVTGPEADMLREQRAQAAWEWALRARQALDKNYEPRLHKKKDKMLASARDEIRGRHEQELQYAIQHEVLAHRLRNYSSFYGQEDLGRIASSSRSPFQNNWTGLPSLEALLPDNMRGAHISHARNTDPFMSLAGSGMSPLFEREEIIVQTPEGAEHRFPARFSQSQLSLLPREEMIVYDGDGLVFDNRRIHVRPQGVLTDEDGPLFAALGDASVDDFSDGVLRLDTTPRGDNTFFVNPYEELSEPENFESMVNTLVQEEEAQAVPRELPLDNYRTYGAYLNELSEKSGLPSEIKAIVDRAKFRQEAEQHIFTNIALNADNIEDGTGPAEVVYLNNEIVSETKRQQREKKEREAREAKENARPDN